jgi:PII-like signaling protein
MPDTSVPKNEDPASQRDARALPQEGVLLRVFIGEDDRHEHRPLYEAIVFKARELRLAGATVLRGPLGFGRSSHIHTANILRLSNDLPMVIEIVDTEEKIASFLPYLDEILEGGLVTMERVQVLHYRQHKASR